MKDFSAWLNDLANEALPGGVSAAALASAMGAALVAKAARASLQRRAMSELDRTALQAVGDLARQQQQVLTGLAEADERAYRAVLAGHGQENASPAEGEAWYEAIEIPIQIVEACHLLLGRLPKLLDLCWSPVEPDLQVGQWLLEVGLRAGLSAAASNMRTRADDKELVPLQVRMNALKRDLEAEGGSSVSRAPFPPPPD